MLREIRYAKRDGIHIVPVGAAVGGRQEMINMASDKKQGVFFSPTFRELNNISDDLVRYLLEGRTSSFRNWRKHCEGFFHEFCSHIYKRSFKMYSQLQNATKMSINVMLII